MFRIPLVVALVLLPPGGAHASRRPDVTASRAQRDQWPAYGGDRGGSRFSPQTQITRANVSRLKVAWTYRTGELGQGARDSAKITFEATPLFVDGTLYLSTAFGRVIALDPATGKERWTFDAGVNRSRRFSELTSRGVSAWRDSKAAAPGSACALRIFFASADARLHAIDGRTGLKCAGFGIDGTIDLGVGIGMSGNIDYNVSSPPAIIGDLVVTGAAIGDNFSSYTGNGVVRAWDARTGQERWHWNPVADFPDGTRIGAANAWSVISVDSTRDLLFVPTTSPSPDFFGGRRPGDNRWGNSVVALRGSTGELVWGFQTVHHDLWDYDNAAQPVLVTVRKDGRDVAAVAQPTKMGSLFLLERETGKPIFAVEERAVPATRVAGEPAHPTQPFPTLPRPLMPQGRLRPEDAFGINDAEREECRAMIAKYRNEGIYTPPDLQGTIAYPGNASGTNWGSAAFDPARQILVLNTSRLATLVQLIPRDSMRALRAREPGYEYGNMTGAPYGMRRKTLESSASAIPCNPPPWGTLAAVHLPTGQVKWEVPLGAIPEGLERAGSLRGKKIGVPNGGGPLLTASGLVFIGAAMDDRIRAFNTETGEEIWSAPLPRSGIATPMTYMAGGRQYVVIAAGGHGKMDLPIGDYVIAFAIDGSEQ